MEGTLQSLLGSTMEPVRPAKKVAKEIGEVEEEAPAKPQWVIDSEKKSGIEYDWKPELKAWRPKAGMR
jgi:hypothetical protein